MKRTFTLLTLSILLCAVASYAQETESTQMSSIPLNDGKENIISSKDGNLSITIAGMNFEIGGTPAVHAPEATSQCAHKSKNQRVNFSFGGFGGTSLDHLAIVEIGVNTLTNADYSMYSPEEAAMMPFGSRKSVYTALNVTSMEVALNKRRTLGFQMGVGFSMENYTFADRYTLRYEDGLMRPVALDGDIKKSKLVANYLHMPFLLNWNIKRGFFISAGINLDILIGSHLAYKKPKTTIEGEVTLNPVQVGMTARIGWRKLYGFVNYSFMEMFRPNTGPGGKRLSAGIGLLF